MRKLKGNCHLYQSDLILKIEERAKTFSRLGTVTCLSRPNNKLKNTKLLDIYCLFYLS